MECLSIEELFGILSQIRLKVFDLALSGEMDKMEPEDRIETMRIISVSNEKELEESGVRVSVRMTEDQKKAWVLEGDRGIRLTLSSPS